MDALFAIADAAVLDGGSGGAAWSPYLVGAGIGMLSWLTFYFSDKAIGASGGYATLAGMLGRLVAPRHTASLAYYRDNPPEMNWGLLLLAGLLVGAFLAAWSGGEITNRYLPPMWEARFGPETAPLRTAVAFGGGMLMAFGARLAGGCTSGHGISGTLQLAISSWISVTCFFLGGIAVATLLYRT
jgi:uncharacterized membrane protein YedE/YeeE